MTPDWREILRIPAWKGSFELVKKELELTLEKEILPTVVSEFAIIRRMILGMNSPLVIPSLDARASVEKQQREFTDRLYSSSLLPHVRHQDELTGNTRKEDEGSMPPNFEARDILRTLEQTDLENKLPVWNDGRMIVEERHLALKDEMKFATRKYRAPFGLERIEIKQEEKELEAAGPLYVALTEYKKQNPNTPSPLSVGNPGDKRSGPVETRFRDVLERRRAESEGEAWMRLSVKQEKKWRWGIRLSRNQRRRISPLRNCCRI